MQAHPSLKHQQAPLVVPLSMTRRSYELGSLGSLANAACSKRVCYSINHTTTDRDLNEVVLSRSWHFFASLLPPGSFPYDQIAEFRGVVQGFLSRLADDKNGLRARYRSASDATLWNLDTIMDDMELDLKKYVALVRARLQSESKDASLYPLPVRGELGGVGRFIQSSMSSECGKRPTNEDKYALLPSLSEFRLSNASSSYSGDERKAHPLLPTGSTSTWVASTDLYGGVFDGHNGSAAACYARDHLHFNIANAPTYASDLQQAILHGFETTHRNFLARATHAGNHSGTTASIAIIQGDVLRLANVGDSTAVLYGDYDTPRVLSEHHHVSNPSERALVRGRGAEIVSIGGVDRVDGEICVTRALGYQSAAAHLSPTPHVTAPIKLTTSDRFIVLASDGVWGVMSHEDVGVFVNAVVDEIHSEMRANYRSSGMSNSSTTFTASDAEKVKSPTRGPEAAAAPSPDPFRRVVTELATTADQDDADSSASSEPTECSDYSIIAEALVAEALNLGSNDNITAIVLWVNHPNDLPLTAAQ
eukprot:TRINITY_DN5373_c0_g3_i1.p1 TRINITY_DN5373_c0_g3~~TRINITY_DN5373_c0_g3_i1.p1  ORF type:complete len:534 (+),score=108.00 TRINITY_DN5373_c0_g3_i1:97-1698(+)